MSFLAEFFRERICRWPSHSLGLFPMELSNIVYKNARQSIAEFEKKNKDAIKEIDTTMCRRYLQTC